METGENEILPTNDASTQAYFATVKEDGKDMDRYDMQEVLFNHAATYSDEKESSDYVKSRITGVQKKKKPRARKKGSKHMAHGQNLSKV